MSRLGRWLESLAGWWDGVRLPLGHARTPRWVGEDSGAVRTQPRASPSQDEIDEANRWNRLNFLELKHDEDLPERGPSLRVRLRSLTWRIRRALGAWRPLRRLGEVRPVAVVRYFCPECGYVYVRTRTEPAPTFGCPNDDSVLERQR